MDKMDDVPIESSKQNQFVKSIKKIKKLLKKNEAQDGSQETISGTVQDGNIRKKPRKSKGLVYLSHIPHGFYEHEMTQYFRQFGVVTNARVIRSKRTGRSKGYAFVEFKDPAVAIIVAETMNNYLMGKRLIKAAYIPPEKQRRAMRKHWNTVNNPGNDYRIKMKKAYNADKDEDGQLKKAKKLISNLNHAKKKLKELGINYDFFTPVDIPEALQKPKIKKDQLVEDTVKEGIEDEVKRTKKIKKEQKLQGDKKEIKLETSDQKTNEETDSEVMEEIMKPKKKKSKAVSKAIQLEKNIMKERSKKFLQNKRKASQSSEVIISKKPKFEKKTNAESSVKKQLKKKKYL